MNLKEELLLCGASDQLSDIFYPSGSAYVLIGMPGIGKGNGSEWFQDGSANEASIDVHFKVMDSGWDVTDLRKGGTNFTQNEKEALNDNSDGFVPSDDTNVMNDTYDIGNQSLLYAMLDESNDKENHEWKQWKNYSLPTYFSLNSKV